MISKSFEAYRELDENIGMMKYQKKSNESVVNDTFFLMFRLLLTKSVFNLHSDFFKDLEAFSSGIEM